MNKVYSENPLVSIIVPSYNQGKFIRKTLESILEQEYCPLEVIVIDGASTDETLSVLHEFDEVAEVHWISEPDRGVVEAVNKGFAQARGEIAAIQSSDDYYLPGAIHCGVKALLDNSELGLVFGDIIKIDADGKELMKAVLKPFSMENILSLQTWIPQPSCFFRMPLAKQLGGWRESVPYAADTDLWMRILLQADARKIDAFIAKRRVHGEQRDIHGDRIIRDYSQTITDLFDRFNAPPKLRPPAEAGVLLMTNRYSSHEKKEIKVQRIEKAIKLYPPLKAHLISARGVPGLGRAKALVRRFLGTTQA